MKSMKIVIRDIKLLEYIESLFFSLNALHTRVQDRRETCRSRGAI